MLNLKPTEEQRMLSDSLEKTCRPNFEQECYRLRDQAHKLEKENELLKKALINIALRLGD